MFRSFSRCSDRYFLATPPDPRGLEASVAAAWLALAGLVLVYAWRSGNAFSREKAAALVAASLLLAPYAAGNSYLTVLAVGIIPLVIVWNPLAVVLLILTDLPYFANRQIQYDWSANYWTALLIFWIALAAYQDWNKRQAAHQLSTELIPMA